MTLKKQQVDQLRLLKLCPQKLRKQFIEKANKQCIKTICECCLNTLNGNIPLTARQKKSLSKHKATLRKLSQRKLSLTKKRKIIIQKGGFLNVLIPSVLGVITSLIHG